MSAAEFPANIGLAVDLQRQSLKKAVENRLNQFSIDHLVPKAEPFYEAVPIFYEDHFEEAYQDLIADGYYPFIISNHQGHPDGPVFARITHRLVILANEVRPPDNPLKGFKVLVAGSMGSGHQGPVVKAAYDQAKGYMRDRLLFPLDIARETDKEAGLEIENQELIRELLEGPKEEFGIAMLPEGNMEGGRRPLVDGRRVGPRHHINGMSRPQKNFLARAYQHLTRHYDRKIMYISAGMHGSYRILDPENSRPTLRAAAAALFGIGDKSEFMTASVGLPETTEQIQDLYGKSLQREVISNVSDHLMQRIKPHVPPVAWGVFR